MDEQETAAATANDADLPLIFRTMCRCPACGEARLRAVRALVAERDRVRADLESVAVDRANLRDRCDRQERTIGDLQEIRRALEEGAGRMRAELARCRPPTPAWGSSGPSAEQYRGARAVPVVVEAVGVSDGKDHTEITLYLRR